MKAKRAIVIVVSLIFVAAVVLFGFSWSSRAAAQPDGVVPTTRSSFSLADRKSVV